MPKRTGYARPSRQKGVTLVVALIVLVLIMMLGIVAVSTSDTQFKLAGNLQFEDGAMNNAEAAVAEGESWLSAVSNFENVAFDGGGPAITPDPGPSAAVPFILPMTNIAAIRNARALRPFSMTWSDDNSASVPMKDGSGNLNPQQRYFIELMSKNNRLQGSSQVVGGRSSSTCNQVNTYLVTGWGRSARGATKLVQSYYSVLSCVK